MGHGQRRLVRKTGKKSVLWFAKAWYTHTMLGRTGKQFLWYYILFFICLVILFVPLYYINLSMVSKSYLDAERSLLETGLSNLENDLGHLETLARTFYDNPRFRRLSYIRGEGGLDIVDYYYLVPLVSDFKRYFAAAGMVLDCGIIYESDMILTTKRLYFSGEEFYHSYFMKSGTPVYAQWIGELPLTEPMGRFIPLSGYTTLEGSYEAIGYVINFSNMSQKHAFFFATLEKNYILSRLATDEILQKGRIVISDSLGSTLLDSSPETNAGAGLDKNNMAALKMTGPKRDITVTVDIPRTVFSERLTPFRRLAFVFALSYLVAGLILSLCFASRSAKPIREIVEEVLSFGERRTPDGSPTDFKNDYKYIQHFLSRASRDIETFKTRLVQQEESQRENFFERLLHGLVYSTATYQSAKDYFPDFPDEFRIAAVLLPNMEEAALAAHAMRQAMIQDIIKPRMPRGGYVHFSGNTLILLLPEEEPESLLRRLRELASDLRGKLNTTCKVALSECAGDIRDIHRAFYLVRHLLRLPRNTGDEEILRKENIAPSSFPIEVLDASRLYELLLHAEEDKAADFINHVFDELRDRGYTDENDIQQIFFLYRRILLQIVNDLDLDIRKDDVIPAYDSHLEVSLLFARLLDSVKNICGVINARYADTDGDFERSVITYIDDNITNPELYTKMITGFFHISENRLQAIVRKYTGKSFLEYVESKRMALSREKLLKTSLPISRVTVECGYSSENTFYKAFRRYFGMSPSEVRK
jgi:AraC-like DNA-binding protein